MHQIRKKDIEDWILSVDCKTYMILLAGLKRFEVGVVVKTKWLSREYVVM